jgi:hypothetical protein
MGASSGEVDTNGPLSDGPRSHGPSKYAPQTRQQPESGERPNNAAPVVNTMLLPDQMDPLEPPRKRKKRHEAFGVDVAVVELRTRLALAHRIVEPPLPGSPERRFGGAARLVVFIILVVRPLDCRGVP